MTFKIISLNVWHGGKLMPAVLNFLKAENPDIIALQEVYAANDPALPGQYNTVQTLQQKLDYPYAHFAQAFVTDLAIGEIPQGNAVLSKFPISNATTTFLSESTLDLYRDEPEFWPIEPRVLQLVQLDAPTGRVTVANMHGVWDLDGDNPSQSRQEMVDIILQKTTAQSHTVLTGDTNAKDTNPVMLRLGEHLESIFGTELSTTFNMRQKTNPGYATAAVDHMYISSDFRVVSKDCPDINISDHLPLVVELEVV